MSILHGPVPLDADQLLLILLCAILTSVIGLGFALFFETLIFLDTLGTAFVALALGPLWGATFGAVTNLVTGIMFPPYRKFLIVNVVCGAVWGLMGKCPWISGGAPTGLSFGLAVLFMGAVVGLVSGLIATAIRMRLKSPSRHILDQVKDQLLAKNRGYFVLAPVEFSISHFPDKALTSAVALTLVLVFMSKGNNVDHMLTNYRDLVDVLAAFYYVAFGVAVKVLKINLAQGDLFALLGPLGFFGVLSALPALAHVLFM